jgi:hypothetical protein
MGERTRYSPGTFSWVDLRTPDQEDAKRFYSELFGWEITDMPVNENVVYAMAALDDHWVAGISPLGDGPASESGHTTDGGEAGGAAQPTGAAEATGADEPTGAAQTTGAPHTTVAAQPTGESGGGAPPIRAEWKSYLTVEDVEATARRARELGGRVPDDPFDVFQAGRMVAIRDPQGAEVMAWQPNGHIGAGLVNVPGALAWNELGSPDPLESARFYGQLVGWRTTPMEGADPPYLVVISGAGHVNGGIRPPAPAGAPPFWLVYFASRAIDEDLRRIAELGGAVLFGATAIGDARTAVAADPQGATFALYEGELDP